MLVFPVSFCRIGRGDFAECGLNVDLKFKSHGICEDRIDRSGPQHDTSDLRKATGDRSFKPGPVGGSSDDKIGGKASDFGQSGLKLGAALRRLLREGVEGSNDPANLRRKKRGEGFVTLSDHQGMGCVGPFVAQLA